MITDSSRVDAVITALAAGLAQRGGLVDVGVFEEPQKAGDLGVEFIIVAYSVEATQTWAGLGARARDELFTLHGLLETKVAGAGDEPTRTVRQRAYELLAEVEAQVRDDSTLGATRTYNGQLVAYRYEPMVDGENRYARISFDIECKARLN